MNCCWCGLVKEDHQLFENEYWCNDNNYLGKTYIDDINKYMSEFS